MTDRPTGRTSADAAPRDGVLITSGPINMTIVRLTARSLLGRRRALLLLALPAILLLLCGLGRILQGPSSGMSVELVAGLGLGTVVPLLGLIAGTGAIGPEIDDGSIVYLLSKPLRRSTIVVSKLVVAMGITTVVAAVPIFLAGVVLSGSADRLALAYGVGAAVAGMAYCALFLLLAVVTRSAVVVGLLYALIWETLVGSFVPGAQVLSIRQWALAISERVMGAGAEDIGVTAAVSFGTGAVLLTLVVVGCTWYAGQRLRGLRLTSSE